MVLEHLFELLPLFCESWVLTCARFWCRVLPVGSGFAGIIAGIRIDQRLKNVDLSIYEKNSTVGGTWYEVRVYLCT